MHTVTLYPADVKFLRKLDSNQQYEKSNQEQRAIEDPPPGAIDQSIAV